MKPGNIWMRCSAASGKKTSSTLLRIRNKKIWQAYHLSLPYFSLYQSCQPLTRFCHTT
jgi:hypothetical protein